MSTRMGDLQRRRLEMPRRPMVSGEIPDPGPPPHPQPTDPPPAEPPPPAPAKYVRGSLTPLFQLTPRNEYGRFVEGGDEGAGGADISPLTKKGVPGFSPIQDNRTYFSYHHSAADTLDKIVPHELAENAAIVAVTAYALANLEEPLPR